MKIVLIKGCAVHDISAHLQICAVVEGVCGDDKAVVTVHWGTEKIFYLIAQSRTRQ